MHAVRNLRSQVDANAENAANPINGKRVLPARSARPALGELANRAINKDSIQHQGIKKAQQPRLTKQKAIVGLLRAKSTQVQQQQKQQKNEEPMEVVCSPPKADALPDDDEHMDVDQATALPEASKPLVDMSEVDDIDADDWSEPQLVAEYTNEIHAYMRHLENAQSIKADYLAAPAGVKMSIKPRMRNMLVDWMAEVHLQFQLLQETLFLSIALLDQFLAKEAKSMTTKELQLVGVTALFLASKYEEMYPPEIGDFVYITDKTYTDRQIRQMEIKMIGVLDFNIGRPLPINFLRRYSKAANVDVKIHSLAKYVIELGTVEYKMAHVPPSMLAAAAIAFAIRVLDPNGSSLRTLWTPTLVHYTTYDLEEFSGLLSTLSDLIFNIDIDSLADKEKAKKLRFVTKKFADKKFHKIALIPELKGTAIKELISGDF